MKKLALIFSFCYSVFGQNTLENHLERFVYEPDGLYHEFEGTFIVKEAQDILMVVPSDELCEHKIKMVRNEMGYREVSGANRFRNDKIFSRNSFLNDSYFKTYYFEAGKQLNFEFNDHCKSDWIEPVPFMLQNLNYTQLKYEFILPDSMDLMIYFDNDSTVFTKAEQSYKKTKKKITIAVNYAKDNGLNYVIVPNGTKDLGAFTAQKFLRALDTITPIGTNELALFPKLEPESDTLDYVFKVQEFIKKEFYYLDQENANGGYIPRNANVVCARKAGDCKDFSLLIYEVLKANGLKSELVLSKANGYDSIVFPSKGMFNHVFNIFHFKGQDYFLDLTDKSAAKGQASRHTENTYYLSTRDGQLHKVPSIPNSGMVLKRNMLVREQNNEILGQDTFQLTGSMAYDLAYYNNDKDRLDLCKNYLNELRTQDKAMAYKVLSDSLLLQSSQVMMLQAWSMNTNLINAYQKFRFLDFKKLINIYPLVLENQNASQEITISFDQNIKLKPIQVIEDNDFYQYEIKSEQVAENKITVKYQFKIKKYLDEAACDMLFQSLQRIKPLKYELL